MATDIAYQLLGNPEGRVDGSGQVMHDMQAVGREIATDPWTVIPNHHKTFLLTEVEVNHALDQSPDAAKITAYRDALEANVNTQPTSLPEPPASDWSEEGLNEYIVAYEAWATEFTAQNQASADAAARVAQFIADKGWPFPIQFRLSI